MRQFLQLSNIKEIARFKGVNLPDLAKRSGLDYVKFLDIVKSNSATFTEILNFSEILDVPIQCFFVEISKLEKVMHWDLDLPVDVIREYRINETILGRAMEKLAEKELLITALKNQIVALELKKQVRKQNGGS